MKLKKNLALRITMTNLFTVTMTFIILTLSPSLSFAANHYIRSSATGNNNGTNWENAWTSLPSSLIRGDTYYISDGNYPSYTFDTPTSGSTVITVKKATQNDHGTNEGWQTGYGDGTATFSPTIYFNTSYWVFDGMVGNGDGSTEQHGFTIDYRSGTNINVKLIRLNNSPSHVTVRHTAMLHAGGLGSTQDGRDSFYTTSASNIIVSHCYIYNSGRCPFLFRSLTDSIIEYNYIRKNESTSADHAEAISAYINCARNIVRHNVWEDTEGTGVLMIAGDGWEIYGNLMFNFSSNDCAIGTWRGKDQSTFGLTNTKIYNNSFINGVGYNQGTAFYDGDTGNEVYNNIWYNCNIISFRGTQTHNANLFSDNNTRNEAAAEIWTGGQSLFVNYANNNFRLATNTRSGISLASPYNIDMLNVYRASDGIWDKGAFEYNSNNPDSSNTPVSSNTFSGIPPATPATPILSTP